MSLRLWYATARRLRLLYAICLITIFVTSCRCLMLFYAEHVCLLMMHLLRRHLMFVDDAAMLF